MAKNSFKNRGLFGTSPIICGIFEAVDAIEPIDYIIVGQGIAGSALAMQALRRKKKILVIDQPAENISSRVAAGLFNPITGKNTVKTWMADKIFPYLISFYKEVEVLTGTKFFSARPLYKPFSSIHEQNDWMGKSADELYIDYVEEVRSKPLPGNQVKDPFGGLMLQQCGYINTIAYMEAVRNAVREGGQFLEAHFDEETLECLPDKVVYKGHQARFLILCQGIQEIYNKRFKKLPIRPLKGETLSVKSEWEKDVILNRGVYMVPGSGSGSFRTGATYRFNDLSPGTTEEGRVELTDKLAELINMPFEVSGQDWGIRPTTVDRRPIIGSDPVSERVVVFNGLGTKGVSLAPYFSELLIHWLEGNAGLNKEVALARFK